ncbi:Protein of unknown function [Cotesia congregata]|uniref:Uncharacterized protein n=1 Tax=Cotesia congregata TaxID=51543 RepID=A0A8J2HU02_COTCN|nr:Protein of unknown function [Cotesia congregata]
MSKQECCFGASNSEVAKKYIEFYNKITSVDEESSNEDEKLTMENIVELIVSNKKIGDDNNYNKTCTQPSTSKQYTEDEVYQVGDSNKVEDNIEGVQTALLKKDKKKSLCKQQPIQQRSDEHDYEQLHQRLLQFIHKDKKLYDETDPDPLYWAFMGSDYSYVADILIEATSKDLCDYVLAKKKGQNPEAIRIKLRINEAHKLLLILHDCYNLIYNRLRKFQKQRTHRGVFLSYLRINNLDYETKIELIQNQIEDLNKL